MKPNTMLPKLVNVGEKVYTVYIYVCIYTHAHERERERLRFNLLTPKHLRNEMSNGPEFHFIPLSTDGSGYIQKCGWE